MKRLVVLTRATAARTARSVIPPLLPAALACIQPQVRWRETQHRKFSMFNWKPSNGTPFGLKDKDARAAADAEEMDRAERLAALRERMKKTWTLSDPLHLKFIAAEALAKTSAKRDPDVINFLSQTVAVTTYGVAGLIVAG